MRMTSTRHAVSNALSVRSTWSGTWSWLVSVSGGASDVVITQCTQTCAPQTYRLGTE